MKKRVLSVLSLTLTLASFSTAGLAEETVYDWQEKLQRGAVNIVTSPVEVAVSIHNMSQEKNLLVGWTVGLVAGIGQGLLRFGAGAIDLLTFPFDFPVGGKAPIIDPEYVWEKPGPELI
jgi:putative exosortase-associated protein (TIGR04073 family)